MTNPLNRLWQWLRGRFAPKPYDPVEDWLLFGHGLYRRTWPYAVVAAPLGPCTGTCAVADHPDAIAHFKLRGNGWPIMTCPHCVGRLLALLGRNYFVFWQCHLGFDYCMIAKKTYVEADFHAHRANLRKDVM